MKFLDLFAGIGGFRRGMELAGHECVGFCEFDRFAVASYTSMHLITDEQREYLASMPIKKRQKEILKEEYRNGEWYANDIRRLYAGDIPAADCWCFGFPCQDISVAGRQHGFQGNRSSLFFRVMYLIGQLEEEKKPTYLFIENVKNLLSVNGGWDFARLLVELEAVGYDAEWEVLNSKDFGVPQSRERCFIVGHLRGRGSAEVFPVERADGENRTEIRELPSFVDLCYEESRMTCVARCLMARYYKGIENYAGQCSGIAIPVLTPDRAEKRQNGRRMKENGEPMFTLTVQDRQGVAVEMNGVSAYAIWYEKYQCYIAIRRLTPKECFRLQGWTDEYYERAEFVNSDSQLYKQAGNGVTVNVIEVIGKKLQMEGEVL